MIRDPSDGSVKEIPKPELDSGLPKLDERGKELKRLKDSREWLKRYQGNEE